MAPVMTAELPTTDFGLWARRARLIFPVPLNSGYAARIDLPWEELLEVSDNRIEITNAGGGSQTIEGARSVRAARDLPKPVQDLLASAQPLLFSPQQCVFAARTDASGAVTLVVGLIRGADGLVVVDSEETVRLVKVGAADVASAVIGVFPSPRPASITPAEMNDRAIDVVGGGIGPKGPDRRASAGLASCGVDHATADVLVRLHRQSNAQGMIGALRFIDGEPHVSDRDVSWSEGPPGAVLKRNLGAGAARFEPASRAALVSAAIWTMAGAKQ